MSRQQANLFFQVVARRCEHAVLDTDLTFGSWDSAFGGDSVLTASVLNKASLAPLPALQPWLLFDDDCDSE